MCAALGPREELTKLALEQAQHRCGIGMSFESPSRGLAMAQKPAPPIFRNPDDSSPAGTQRVELSERAPVKASRRGAQVNGPSDGARRIRRWGSRARKGRRGSGGNENSKKSVAAHHDDDQGPARDTAEDPLEGSG